MVLATAVPKIRKATKLKKAAQITARLGRQDPGRDDGGHGVGRVVHAVGEVEGQGDGDDEDDETEAPLHRQLPLTTMPSTVLLMFWKTSMMCSSVPRMSFHLMTAMGSFSSRKRARMDRW